ncbi:hypothetical protein [Pedobacter rhizosphaerae]|uniref:Uncharacterized protein n=1 Tax=Pedobacter rhizosphaerae TaxID=390241 RepID=A0A1H9U9U9_9SPHI|nr:hypothetical protein [Pedobacter rhizosphaerae]SES06340.1 hypothetical protein SAMN04488023_1293 [Pedobacter rhizosphaerae]
MEYNFVTEEITEIIADLDIIAKYHSGSKALLHPDKPNILSTKANIRLLIGKEGDKLSLVDDFNIAKVVLETGLEHSHVQNLFVLTRNMIDIEWGYYKTHFTSEDTNEINLHSRLRILISELKILKEQLEGRGILETKIKLRQLMNNGKSMVPYDVPNMGVTIDSKEENLEIIKLVLLNRFRQITELSYLYLHITTEEPSKWSADIIEQMLEYFYQPFSDARAKWLFGRYATQNIIAYLKAETNFHKEDIEVTQQQGVLIYTLFLLFGLIDIKIEDGIPEFKSDRDKAKLIRSFLRQDLKDKEIEFYNLMFTFFPVEN